MVLVLVPLWPFHSVHFSPRNVFILHIKDIFNFSDSGQHSVSFQSCVESLPLVFSLWSKLCLCKPLHTFHHQKCNVFIQIIKAIELSIPVEKRSSPLLHEHKSVLHLCTGTCQNLVSSTFGINHIPKDFSRERGKFRFPVLHSFNDLHKWGF